MAAAKILVLDDHLIHRTLLADQLQDEGYDVVAAGDLDEARRLLEEQKPDLILSDIVLEGDRFSAIRWARALREDAMWRSLPILFVTAYYDEMKRHVEDLAETDLLEKPFTARAVKGKIKEMLPKS